MPGSPHRPLALPRVQWAGQRMVTPPNKDKAEKTHGAPHTSGKDSAQSERQALQHDARGHGVSFRTLGPVEAAKKKKLTGPWGTMRAGSRRSMQQTSRWALRLTCAATPAAR